MSARVEWLTLAGDPQAWRSIGVVVDEDGFVPLIGTSLRIQDRGDGPGEGIVGWALSGLDPDLDLGHGIDGLPTERVDACAPRFASHEIGASGLDHVVVTTDELERTTRAIGASTGAELKRVREVGNMRQGFHRIGRGGLIVEVVTRPGMPVGPAEFWGLVINVDDLDAACARIGTGGVSAPKAAVQRDRSIATIRDEVGLGLPVALMTS